MERRHPKLGPVDPPLLRSGAIGPAAEVGSGHALDRSRQALGGPLPRPELAARAAGRPRRLSQLQGSSDPGRTRRARLRTPGGLATGDRARRPQAVASRPRPAESPAPEKARADPLDPPRGVRGSTLA